MNDKLANFNELVSTINEQAREIAALQEVTK